MASFFEVFARLKQTVNEFNEHADAKALETFGQQLRDYYEEYKRLDKNEKTKIKKQQQIDWLTLIGSANVKALFTLLRLYANDTLDWKTFEKSASRIKWYPNEPTGIKTWLGYLGAQFANVSFKFLVRPGIINEKKATQHEFLQIELDVFRGTFSIEKDKDRITSSKTVPAGHAAVSMDLPAPAGPPLQKFPRPVVPHAQPNQWGRPWTADKRNDILNFDAFKENEAMAFNTFVQLAGLEKKDIEDHCLKANGWFNGNQVSTFFLTLAAVCQMYNRKIVTFPSDIINAGKRHEQQQSALKFAKTHVQNGYTFIYPQNYENNHWVFIAIEKQVNNYVFKYWDSLQQTRKPLQQWIDTFQELAVQKQDAWYAQKDGVSCGPLTCANAYNFVWQVPFDKTQRLDAYKDEDASILKGIRKEIALVILTGTLYPPATFSQEKATWFDDVIVWKKLNIETTKEGQSVIDLDSDEDKQTGQARAPSTASGKSSLAHASAGTASEWTIIKAKADGNCMFTAVANAIVSGMSPAHTIALAKYLRKATVYFEEYVLQKHSKCNYNFTSMDTYLIGKPQEDVKRRTVSVEPQQYFKHMKMDKVWGGVPELNAMSTLLETDIRILKRDTDEILYSFAPVLYDRAIALYYNGRDHYDSAIKTRNPTWMFKDTKEASKFIQLQLQTQETKRGLADKFAKTFCAAGTL